MNDDPKSDNPRGWQSKGEVKPAGKYLTLSAEDARKYGLVEDVVNDYDELCSQENVNPTEVTLIDADWLNALAEFLCNPWTSVRAGDARRDLPHHRAEDAGGEPAGRHRRGLLRAVLLVAVAGAPADHLAGGAACSSSACC